MITMLLIREIGVLALEILMGWALVKTKVMKSEDSYVLSALSIYLIYPVVIINAFQVDYTPEIMRGFLLAVLAAILLHGVLMFISWLLQRLKLTNIEVASVVYSNSGNLVFPLVTAVLGPEWVIYASAFLMTQLFFFWTHAQSLIRGERCFTPQKLLTNFNLISALVGLVLFILHIKLPAVPARAFSAISALIGPICMIMLGMIFAGSPVREIFRNKRMYPVILLKMVVVPLVVLVLLKFTGLHLLAENGRTILLITLMAVITPSASSVSQLALLYHREPEYAAAINVATTVVSAVTMPLMVFLYTL